MAAVHLLVWAVLGSALQLCLQSSKLCCFWIVSYERVNIDNSNNNSSGGSINNKDDDGGGDNDDDNNHHYYHHNNNIGGS